MASTSSRPAPRRRPRLEGFARCSQKVRFENYIAEQSHRSAQFRPSGRARYFKGFPENRVSAATEKAPSRFGLRARRRRLTETALGVDGKLSFSVENDSLGGSCRRVKRELCGLGRPVGGAGSPGIDLRLPETDACRRRSGRKQRRVARFRRAHRRNNIRSNYAPSRVAGQAPEKVLPAVSWPSA